MFKNKIVWKLAGYFALCLLAFSIVIGGVFIALFRNYSFELQRKELTQRGSKIALTLGELQGEKGGGHGNGQGGYGAYLRFLDDIAMSDCWVVDKNMELITRTNSHHEGANISYKDLPSDADAVVAEVFAGKTAYSKSFSDLIGNSTLTVGTPITAGGQVVGALLLHAPIDNADEALAQGIKVFLISLAAALAISLVLALWLSKSFTDPIVSFEAAEALRLETLRREFLANVSHELKTPVAVVRGSLEALVDGVVTEPCQVSSYHREMLSETVHLERLVLDLLDLSRLQNADFEIEMHEISADELAQDVIRSARHIASKKGVEIVYTKEDEPRPLIGDYGRLRQMFIILLDNAVKFSPCGGRVEFALSVNAAAVRDSGAGIPKEQLPYIFERFFKSRSEKNKSGTGLGLAIAKQIALRHGFDISAENAESGAVFTVHFKH